MTVSICMFRMPDVHVHIPFTLNMSIAQGDAGEEEDGNGQGAGGWPQVEINVLWFRFLGRAFP